MVYNTISLERRLLKGASDLDGAHDISHTPRASPKTHDPTRSTLILFRGKKDDMKQYLPASETAGGSTKAY
jgi:hypothetical protein